MNRSLLAAVGIQCLWICIASGQSQQPVDPPADPAEAPSLQEQTRDETSAAEARRTKIREEITALKTSPAQGEDAWANEWAGEYSCGDGLGMNVSIAIAPRNGVVYMWRGCVGLYDVNHGEIEKVLPDRLVVKLKIDPALSIWEYMSAELLLVRWGERHYLVPTTQVDEFCNSYNDGSLRASARSTDIPMLVRDRGKPVGEFPVAPDEIRGRLLTQPITAEIRPIWLPFAADTLAFAAPVALLWFGFPAARRIRRRRRGLCVDCAYDLRGLATCPECGTASGAR